MYAMLPASASELLRLFIGKRSGILKKIALHDLSIPLAVADASASKTLRKPPRSEEGGTIRHTVPSIKLDIYLSNIFRKVDFIHWVIEYGEH